MKKVRILIFTLLCVLPAQLSFAQFRSQSLPAMEESSTVKALRSGVEYLSSAMLEGRAPGSEGEKMASEWLSEQFRAAGLDVLSPEGGDVFGLRQPEGDTLVSRNVAAFIPGYDSKLKDRYIVIGARLDNIGSLDYEKDSLKSHKIFYGANGNASGLAMLSCLAERLSRTRVLLKRSVILVGFGASTNMCAGSWYFLNRSFPDADKIDAMVNLDILGLPSGGFYVYTSSNPDLNDLISRMSLTLQPLHPTLVSNEPVISDHRSFYEKEIPSVLFSTGAYREYMTDRDTADILEYDDMERVLEYIYNFTLELLNGAAPEFRRSAAQVYSRSATSDVFQYHECDTKPVFMGSQAENLKQIYDNAKDALSYIVSDDMSEYEKVHAIYDYIIYNVRYDHDCANAEDKYVSGNLSLNEKMKYYGYYLEGIFLDKFYKKDMHAVCDGKSKAFVLMCGIEGITAVRISGKASSDGQNFGGHAWNKVLLDLNGTGDKEWYFVDTTWGDVGDSKEFLSHAYFLLSDDEVKNTHVEKTGHGYPKAEGKFDYYAHETYTSSGTEYNYVIANRNLAAQQMARALKTLPKSTIVEFEFAFSLTKYAAENYAKEAMKASGRGLEGYSYAIIRSNVLVIMIGAAA